MQISAVMGCVAALGIALAGVPAAAQTSKAAAWLAREQIAEACGNAGGTIAPAALIERDLTGDGRADLILFHEGISCKGGGRSGNCGTQACSLLIYVREGDLLVLKGETLSVGLTIGPGEVPVIAGHDHVGGAWSLRWDGQRFR
ncbi:hypothetical protein [Tropicimonas sp. IMCC34043]|uniref:hypothetical protein n=1 Tax=Tropicimonas sp. IMCC34043 TaxID=2248760 RepID=UPI000E256F16|nr:hypothetical protein [Tropicimonas sp. IMCC34043]